jgi:hypothetical protein
LQVQDTARGNEAKHRLAVEAEQEAFLDDAELQNYLAKKQ